MKRRRQEKIIILAAVILIILLILVGAGIYILQKYRVTNIYVEGNIHYTDDEIIAYVLDGRLDYNSLYLSFKYKNREITGVPFVQAMDVDILSPDTIRITVYEKSLAGYVEYLGRYLYFDKDGIVVESSSERTDGIPQVSGLNFTYVTLYEKLPVEDDSIFERILDITKLLSKYKLTADRIYFEDNGEMTLYFGQVRVALGIGDYIDEKITRLQYILPQLSGRSGVLNMKEYQDSSDNVTFVQDN